MLDWRRLGINYMTSMIRLNNLTAATFAGFMSIHVNGAWKVPGCLAPSLVSGRRAVLTHGMTSQFPSATQRIREALLNILDPEAVPDDEETHPSATAATKPSPIDLTADDFFAIRWAVATDTVHLVSHLLDRLTPCAFTPDPSWSSLLQHLFRHAVKSGSSRVVRFLLFTGRVDPTADDDLAIRDACERGYTDIVLILLKFSNPSYPKVDPVARSNYAMRMASQNGHARVVKVLLETGRVTPCALHWAASRGHADIVRMLLDTGRFDPSHEVSGDGSALVEAAENGYAEVVDLLISEGVADGGCCECGVVVGCGEWAFEVCKLLVVTRKVTSAVMPELASCMRRNKELGEQLMPILMGRAY
ncbi:ankyrin repeat-containing domain protein [Chytridium lagenaria]|nr:ankyrin repeat-containing domain protein [Chytridium lagenaria]